MGSQHKFQPSSGAVKEATQDTTEVHDAQAPAVAQETPVIDGQFPEVEAKAMPAIDAAKLSEIAKAFQAKTVGVFQRTKDGGIIGTFTISPELSLVIESWSESTGEPLHSFVQKQIDEALLQFIEGV